VLRSDKAAEILLERQLAGIRALKELGVAVKINTIILPGINDEHIEEIAEKMAVLDVDILNCIPYYPNEGANFAARNMEEPSKKMIASVRKAAGKYIKQMHHCTRCRADAVGLLGDSPEAQIMEALKTCSSKPKKPSGHVEDPDRPHVAVATMEGVLINQHLGEAYRLQIYGRQEKGDIRMVDNRPAPEPGGGDTRWLELADKLKDCRALLVSGIGTNPRDILSKSGIKIYEMEGMIEDAVERLFSGESLNHPVKRNVTQCGVECMGGGMGCG
jgi:nitrogen fixation protein NifB